MRLLIDANLSPRVASRLCGAGHDAVHVADIGMLGAADQAILAHAANAGQVIITADTDFGELLAVSGATRPSVVLLRSADHLTPDQQATLLIANLPAVAADLDSGAAVSIARGRLRVRPLPVHPAPDPPGLDPTNPAMADAAPIRRPDDANHGGRPADPASR